MKIDDFKKLQAKYRILRRFKPSVISCPMCDCGAIIPYSEIGKIARIIRNERNVSLRELGKIIGVSAPYVSDLEKGHRNLTVKKFEKILEELA